MLKNNFGLWLNHLEQWRNWKFIIKYHRERKKCICALVITLNLQYIQYWEALLILIGCESSFKTFELILQMLKQVNLYSSSYFTSGRWKVCADLRQIAYLTRWLLLVVRLSAILGSVHFKTLPSQHIHSILISVFQFLNHHLYLISKFSFWLSKYPVMSFPRLTNSIIV